MKIAINNRHGGFGISDACYARMVELGYGVPEQYRKWQVPDERYWACKDRTNPLLIQAIEELGEGANEDYSNLVIVEIPDNTPYEIEDYDGYESVIAPKIIYG